METFSRMNYRAKKILDNLSPTLLTDLEKIKFKELIDDNIVIHSGFYYANALRPLNKTDLSKILRSFSPNDELLPKFKTTILMLVIALSDHWVNLENVKVFINIEKAKEFSGEKHLTSPIFLSFAKDFVKSLDKKNKKKTT